MHDVSAIIAGIVPTAMVLVGPALSRGGVRLCVPLARGRRVAASKVNVATAALAVVSAHGEQKSVAMHIVANFKGYALPGVGLEHIHARLTDREISVI